MGTDRRTVLKYGIASLAAMQASGAGIRGQRAAAAPADEPIRIEPNPGYQRIACEEAWTTKEVVDAQLKLAQGPWAQEQPYVASMTAGMGRPGPRQDLLQDIGAGRIANMDRLGIQKQVLMFTAPGVQILDADTGTALARVANDQMAEAIRTYPDRLAGLTVIAPQDPRRAVVELERGMTRLGLNGAIVNSHMKENLYITTSGMAWAPAIKFCQEVLGVDHVLYAMDYPYQMDDYEVVATDTMPIPFDHKKKLFQTNAERLFHL